MWTANDPAGKDQWHGVWFPGFFFFLIFVFIYFHQVTDEFIYDHSEKIFGQSTLKFKYNSPGQNHLIFS